MMNFALSPQLIVTVLFCQSALLTFVSSPLALLLVSLAHKLDEIFQFSLMLGSVKVLLISFKQVLGMNSPPRFAKRSILRQPLALTKSCCYGCEMQTVGILSVSFWGLL